jgi:V/A-type H+-transporting ATPase subunit I
MIVTMLRVRLLGPRERHDAVLRRLQDVGLVHLAPPAEAPLLVVPELGGKELRLRRRLSRLADLADATLALLGAPHDAPPPRGPRPALPVLARRAHRTHREATRLSAQLAALDEEATLLARYNAIFRAFEPLLRSQARWASGRVYHIVLRAGQAGAAEALRGELTNLLGQAYELRTQPLPDHETAVLIVVPEHAAPQVEKLLAQGRISEVAMPGPWARQTLAQAMPAMLARLRAIPNERAQLERRRAELRRQEEGALRHLARGARDLLARLDARALSRLTKHAFVLEGWLPEEQEARLTRALKETFGDEVVLEIVDRDHWSASDAPVVLRNPRLFRPFELIIKLLPLPTYGSMDPTPFVAVFFPMFFGLILGDLGYGLLLVILGMVLRRRSAEGTTLRSVAEILEACAVFSLIFGLLFGEFFGDLGRRWFGLHALWFDREEAVIPFLVLAVALGAVHMLLGLVIGAVTSFKSHRHQALGRGLAAVMLVLVVVALLAGIEVLPHGLLTPAAIVIFAALPVLVVLEGIVAPVEFLSTLGRVLSYARIMALGTASVMLAVVANRLAGAFGSLTVGIVFALLFHLVNFALGVFSPAIHALRLHYVEFFGNFYSPGGVAYRPFGHWVPSRTDRA